MWDLAWKGALLAAAPSLLMGRFKGQGSPQLPLQMKPGHSPNPWPEITLSLHKMHMKHAPALHPFLTSLILMKADYKTSLKPLAKF